MNETLPDMNHESNETEIEWLVEVLAIARKNEFLDVARELHAEMRKAFSTYWAGSIERPQLLEIGEKYGLSEDLIGNWLEEEIGDPDEVVSEDGVITAAIYLARSCELLPDTRRTRDGKVRLLFSGYLAFVTEGFTIEILSGYEGKIWLYTNALGFDAELDRLWRKAAEMAHSQADLLVEEVRLSRGEMREMGILGGEFYRWIESKKGVCQR